MGQASFVSRAAQTRMAVGIAKNIPLPFSFRRSPTRSGVSSHKMFPFSMTMTRVANGKASSRRCSVKMIVVPSSRLILPSNARKSAAAMGSN